MNNSLVLASESSRLAALLLGHWPTGQLPRRASPSGRQTVPPERVTLYPDGQAVLWTVTSESAVEMVGKTTPQLVSTAIERRLRPEDLFARGICDVAEVMPKIGAPGEPLRGLRVDDGKQRCAVTLFEQVWRLPGGSAVPDGNRRRR
jgi:hypothetical protein